MWTTTFNRLELSSFFLVYTSAASLVIALRALAVRSVQKPRPLTSTQFHVTKCNLHHSTYRGLGAALCITRSLSLEALDVAGPSHTHTHIHTHVHTLVYYGTKLPVARLSSEGVQNAACEAAAAEAAAAAKRAADAARRSGAADRQA